MAQPRFTPFDPHKEVRIYRRHLPHWRQDGATYFVTFRLGDSIPKQRILQWQREDAAWFQANGVEDSLGEDQRHAAYERIPAARRREFERRSARRMHVELDKCEGCCALRNPVAALITDSAMQFYHGDLWWLGDRVVMPNHVHALVQPLPGADLENILQRMKRFVSTELGKQDLKPKQGTFWQHENYDHIVRDQRELTAFRNYIAQNPGKAGLREDEFLYRRADWL